MRLFCTQCGAENSAADTRCAACAAVLLPSTPVPYGMDAAVQRAAPRYADPFASQIAPPRPGYRGDLDFPAYGTGSLADGLSRFGAFLCDAIVYAMLAIVAMVIGTAIGVSGDLVTALVILLHPTYHIAFWSTTGQTPGYRAARLQLITTDRTKPTVGASMARYLGMQMSQWTLYLGCLWMLWDERKQTWHDKIARTLVIRA